jgi:hypothetical protein
LSRRTEQDGLFSSFIEPTLLSMDEFRAHMRGGQLTDTGIAFMCLSHLQEPATGPGRP